MVSDRAIPPVSSGNRVLGRVQSDLLKRPSISSQYVSWCYINSHKTSLISIHAMTALCHQTEQLHKINPMHRGFLRIRCWEQPTVLQFS